MDQRRFVIDRRSTAVVRHGLFPTPLAGRLGWSQIYLLLTQIPFFKLLPVQRKAKLRKRINPRLKPCPNWRVAVVIRARQNSTEMANAGPIAQKRIERFRIEPSPKSHSAF